MKCAAFELLCVLVLFSSVAVEAKEPAKASTGAEDESAKAPSEETKAKKSVKVPLRMLTPAELDKLLARRLDGSLGYEFRQFSNMFFVKSHIDLGNEVALSTANKEIAEYELQSPFPDSYKPTLRELLDAIALQTSSAWSYKKEHQFSYHEGEAKPEKKDDSGSVVIHFDPVKREKPFAYKLKKGWTALDRGNWINCVPESAPMGLDFYEMGTYSAKNPEEETALFAKIRTDVALHWALLVKKDAVEKDLHPAKIAERDALFFDTMVTPKEGPKIHWRHWVFMDGNKCFFIVSAIFVDQEKKLGPEVEAMVRSFSLKPIGETSTKPQPIPGRQ